MEGPASPPFATCAIPPSHPHATSCRSSSPSRRLSTAPRSQATWPRSQAQCSTVNVAYSTLRCPFRRAKYMLRRMGVDFEEGTSATDPEFIMEILEASCEIEDANRDRKKPALPRLARQEPP